MLPDLRISHRVQPRSKVRSSSLQTLTSSALHEPKGSNCTTKPKSQSGCPAPDDIVPFVYMRGQHHDGMVHKMLTRRPCMWLIKQQYCSWVWWSEKSLPFKVLSWHEQIFNVSFQGQWAHTLLKGLISGSLFLSMSNPFFNFKLASLSCSCQTFLSLPH